MTIKKRVKARVAILLVSTCFVATQPSGTSAWTPTSPQFSVAVFSGTSSNYGQSVALDSSGNIYSTGMFAGTADFDPGAGIANMTSVGSNDVFVSKLDTSGNFVWAKSLGASDCYSVAVDSFGNVYTAGFFYGTGDFDPGDGVISLTSASDADVFVSKLDTSGNYMWAKQFGGNSAEYGFEVAVDSSGNVYTTGNFISTADFDPGPGTANLTGGGAFVSKLDTSGNYVWAKQFRGGARGYEVAVDSSGNVYTTGELKGTADFDPGDGVANLTSVMSRDVPQNSEDVFVSKLDTSGNYMWAKRFGSSGTDNGNTVEVDSSGNVYTAGYFQRSIDFGIANLRSVGSTDVFVSKLDASGNGVWAKSFGGTNAALTRANNVSVDALGNLYATGSFQGTVDFDPGAGTAILGSSGVNSTFVLRLDASNGSSSVTPGVPSHVTATSAADAQSVVSWNAPAFTGGAAISGYTVTSSPGGRTCAWTSGPLSCTVTGLTNGTSYTFTVTATNANGTSGASDASSSVTPTGSQSITFATVGTQLLGKKTVALTATATSSQTIVFTSATPSICTVTGSIVTLLKTGDCTINANQGGGSGWDAAPQVSATFMILPSPPVGEPGVSIKNGDSFSNSKLVTLNVIWPEYATSARISNDGGFAASKTETKDLAASIDWELDDSIKGIYSKVVYVRFNGVADTTKTYTDDIILDTTAPTIGTSSVAVASSSIDILLNATDDLTGVNKVQIRNGTKVVTKDYASKISIPLVDLSLSVSSSGVRKSVIASVEIRVSDNAGNWTGWESVTVAGLIETPAATTPVVTRTVAPVNAPAVAPLLVPALTSPKLTASKSASAKSIATFAKLRVLSTSKVSIRVIASSAKYCKVSGTTLKGVKAGSCKVTVTVTPKKGKATSKTVILKVTK